MRDYLTLGPTPCAEGCAQLGSKDYERKSSIELRIYKDQLKRQFPDCRFGIKSFPHDFGTYYEVVVYFDDDNAEEVHKAIEVENNIPEHWDKEACEALALAFVDFEP